MKKVRESKTKYCSYCAWPAGTSHPGGLWVGGVSNIFGAILALFHLSLGFKKENKEATVWSRSSSFHSTIIITCLNLNKSQF